MSLSRDQQRLLERGTQEIVPKGDQEGELNSEVVELLEEGDKKAYVGYEPSGRLHLGHLLTAQKLKDLEELGFETTVLLADKHAFLNKKPQYSDGTEVPVNPEEPGKKGARDFISDISDMYEAALTAFGLEADIVRGWDFQNKEPYNKLKEELDREIPLSRNRKAIADIASKGEKNIGQVIYPAMQVADIFKLKADVAVGGIDQRAIHMLAREYQPTDYEGEKPVAIHTPIIGNNLSGEKMSSSGSSIPVYANEDDIYDEINKMDFSPNPKQIKAEVEGNTEGMSNEQIIYDYSPVLQLVDHYVFQRGQTFDIERPDKYGGDREYNTQEELLSDVLSEEMHPMDVKTSLAAFLNEYMGDMREAVRSEGLHEPVEELYLD